MPVIKSKLQENPVESRWKSGDKFRRTIVDGKGFVNCAGRGRGLQKRFKKAGNLREMPYIRERFIRSAMQP
jgi:hypothetical protein